MSYTPAMRAKLLRLYRSGRFATLRTFLVQHEPIERRGAAKVYFGQSWRGSVKGSIRHLERVAINRHGEARAIELLLRGFRPDVCR